MIFQRAQATSATYDWSKIARNQQVYGYLQTLMSRAIPGFGGTFSTQYGAQNADQILTEMFDYIRCTNLADNSVTNGNTATPYAGVLGGSSVGTQGQVVPITITSNDGNTTHGMGRIATIGELGLVLMKIDDRKDTSVAEKNNLATTIKVTGAGPTIPDGTLIDPTKTTLIEWALIPKLVSPMNGSVALANNLRLHFSNINLQIGSTSVAGPYPDMFSTGSVNTWRDVVFGGIMGITSLVQGTTASTYPTGIISVPGTSASLGLTGAHSTTISGNVEVQIFAPGSSAATGTPLQTFEFSFGTSPAVTQTAVPIPELWVATASPPTPPPAANLVRWDAFVEKQLHGNCHRLRLRLADGQHDEKRDAAERDHVHFYGRKRGCDSISSPHRFDARRWLWFGCWRHTDHCNEPE